MITWAEDSWINYSIQDLEDPNRPFPYEKYNSWRKNKSWRKRISI